MAGPPLHYRVVLQAAISLVGNVLLNLRAYAGMWASQSDHSSHMAQWKNAITQPVFFRSVSTRYWSDSVWNIRLILEFMAILWVSLMNSYLNQVCKITDKNRKNFISSVSQYCQKSLYQSVIQTYSEFFRLNQIFFWYRSGKNWLCTQPIFFMLNQIWNLYIPESAEHFIQIQNVWAILWYTSEFRSDSGLNVCPKHMKSNESLSIWNTM